MTFLELHKMYRFGGREFGVCIRTFRFLVKTAEERLVGVTSSYVIFAEAGLRRELSRTKTSAIREMPPCGRGVSLHLKKQQSVGINMV